MKLKYRLALIISITFAIAVAVMATLSIYAYWWVEKSQIDLYTNNEKKQIEEALKQTVTNAYNILNTSNNLSFNIPTELQESDNRYSKYTNPLNTALENLRQIELGNEGFIWISEVQTPYRIIMHADKPELEGQGWDITTAKYNLVGVNKRNLYEVFSEICYRQEEGMLEHDFYRQGSADLVRHMSYVKLFKPKNWIIGTGLYTDHLNDEVAAKYNELKAIIRLLIIASSIAGGLLTCAMFFIFQFVGASISRRFEELKENLDEMVEGKPMQLLDVNENDELSQIHQSLNNLILAFETYSNFASELGKGNLDTQFVARSSSDALGNALLEMRRSLEVARIETHRRKEENAKRNWANEGFSKFNEILRRRSGDIKQISDEIISNLVRYLEANQGGLFIYNDDDPNNAHLELIASFAYNRKKHQKKHIVIGEGLIGSCALEKAPVYITEIPDDYISITSGIGMANPTNLLVVPLKLDEQILGVVELASFSKIHEYQIDFVAKVGESIAAALSSAKIDQRTSELLRTSEKQGKAMKQKETEMGKTIKKLELLQTEIENQKIEISCLLNALNETFLVLKFDLEGRTLDVNETALEILQMSRQKILTTNHRDLLTEATETREEYDDFWNRLKKGQVGKKIKFVATETAYLWLDEIYIPILDRNKQPIYILDIAMNITEKESMELKVKQYSSEIEKKNSELERLKTREEAMKKKIEIVQKQLKDLKRNQ